MLSLLAPAALMPTPKAAPPGTCYISVLSSPRSFAGFLPPTALSSATGRAERTLCPGAWPGSTWRPTWSLFPTSLPLRAPGLPADTGTRPGQAVQVVSCGEYRRVQGPGWGSKFPGARLPP